MTPVRIAMTTTVITIPRIMRRRLEHTFESDCCLDIVLYVAGLGGRLKAKLSTG